MAVVGISVLIGLAPFASDQILSNSQNLEFDTNATAVDTENNETQTVGVVTESNLRFGKLPTGVKSIKFFNITAPRKSMITIESSGNISDKLEYNERMYFQGEKEVSIAFNSTEPGYYSGTINVKTQSPKNEWGQRWLDVKSSFY